MVESESRSVAGSRDGGLVAADVGGLAAALSVVVAVATLGVLLAASPLFGGVALAVARDVGNNCGLACLFGALGAAFAAFGAGLTDPWGSRARGREGK